MKSPFASPMRSKPKEAAKVSSEKRLAGLLSRMKGVRLAVAESCTGGLVASRITDIAGCSAFFAGGVVAYSNDLKQRLLNVRAGTLKEYGAVSKEVAAEMAAGAAKKAKADIAVSLTGIAGPGGGTEEKPVGTVYIGITVVTEVKKSGEKKEATFVSLFNFKGNRRSIKRQSATAALDALAAHLEGAP